MEIINLDKFRVFKKVSLGGCEFEIYGLKIKDFLEDSFKSKLEKVTDAKQEIDITIDMLTQFSNIPREILVDQPFPVIKALSTIVRGGDPDESEATDEGGPGNE